MQKIVFLGTPAYGHVNPTLPVVQELVRRGEQVVYYNNEEFRALIEASGADFRPYPESEFSSARLSAALQDGNLANVVVLILDTTMSLLPYLINELRRESPALVIFDGVALWGRMAASAVNARAVASICQFSFDLSSLHMQPRELLRYFGLVMPGLPRILARRRQLTRRFGKALVPQEPPLIPVRGGLNIVYTSRTLHPDIAMIDDTFRFVGPSINPQTRSEEFPFDALGEGPLVYISLGTIHSGQNDFYRQCFQAFADYPAQFVLSAGKHTDLDGLGPVPTNFIVRPSVPQLEILQRTQVFITHGGLNSIHEALYYGVPLLLIPQQAEQLLNARCIAAQGAGLVIASAYLGAQVSAAQLRPALEKLADKPGYRQAAVRLQQDLRATGGYQRAADEIQAFMDNA